LGAGAKAKTVTNKLPLLSVLAKVLFFQTVCYHGVSSVENPVRQVDINFVMQILINNHGL
jgi:hypothetical protein